jgi:hypothetical protein
MPGSENENAGSSPNMAVEHDVLKLRKISLDQR